MPQQISFRVAWGSLFNLSNGKLVVDDTTFTLVPNVALTAINMSLGAKAYSNQTFPIDAIIGYKKVFMAYMAILFNNGSKLRVSIGTDDKKRELIYALEQRRAAIFAARGQRMLPLIQTI